MLLFVFFLTNKYTEIQISQGVIVSETTCAVFVNMVLPTEQRFTTMGTLHFLGMK